MRTFEQRLALPLFAAALAACTEQPGVPVSAPNASQLAAASEMDMRPVGTDPKTGLELFARAAPRLAETDAPPTFDLLRVDPVRRTRSLIATELLDAVVSGHALYLVHADGRLTRQIDGSRALVFEGAFEAPALLASGELVIARRSDEPGESDLWIGGRAHPSSARAGAGPRSRTRRAPGRSYRLRLRA